MSECIIWRGHKDKLGRGQVRYEGRTVRVARLALYKKLGYWPNICRHTCDDPSCWNQDHLIDGTQADNVHDAVERGRNAHNKGEASGRALHGNEEILEIRKLYATGQYTMRSLGSMFNMDSSQISRVIHHQTWSHI